MSEIRGTEGRKRNIFLRLFNYLKALDALGRLLTAIGLLPALADFVARMTGTSLPVPIWIESLWLIFAFGLANFRLYESIAKSDLEIRLREYNINLEPKIFSVDGNRLSVNSNLTVNVSARLDIYNHNQEPVDIRIFIESIESDWIMVDNKAFSDIRTRVSKPGVASDFNHPFNIAGRGIIEMVSVRADVPFKIPEDKKFAYLGSLSKMNVIWGFELAGRTTIQLSVKYDVASIHQAIEDDIRTKLSHNQNLAHQGMLILKEFWQVSTGNKI